MILVLSVVITSEESCLAYQKETFMPKDSPSISGYKVFQNSKEQKKATTRMFLSNFVTTVQKKLRDR
jgi:hypothetical protein